MVGADLLARRVLALSEALGHLDRPEASDPARLRGDPVMRAAVERWLQVAIEACIDVAYHLIASEGWTPPETARAAFRALVAHGRLEADLADRLGLAAGLRNLIVHDYAELDLDLLAAAVRDDLDDLRRFGALAAGWLDEARGA